MLGEAYYNIQRQHISMSKAKIIEAFRNTQFFVCHPDLTPQWQFQQFKVWLQEANPTLRRHYHALDNTLDWDAEYLASRGTSEYWRLKAAALPPGKLWPWSNHTAADGTVIPTYQLDFETARALAEFHRHYTLQSGKYDGVYRDMSLQDYWPPHLWSKAQGAGWSDSQIQEAIAKTALGRRAFNDLIEDSAEISVNGWIPTVAPNVNFVTLEGAGERFSFDEVLSEAYRLQQETRRAPFAVVLWRTKRADLDMIATAAQAMPNTIMVGKGPWHDDPTQKTKK